MSKLDDDIYRIATALGMPISIHTKLKIQEEIMKKIVPSVKGLLIDIELLKLQKDFLEKQLKKAH